VAVEGQVAAGLALLVFDEERWRHERSMREPNWLQRGLYAVFAPRRLVRTVVLRVKARAHLVDCHSSMHAMIQSPSPAAGRLWLELIAVAAQWQGQGLAEQLMRIVEREAIIHDRSAIALSVWSTNIRARRFYERFGFSVTASARGQCTYRKSVRERTV